MKWKDCNEANLNAFQDYKHRFLSYDLIGGNGRILIDFIGSGLYSQRKQFQKKALCKLIQL